MRKRKIEVAEYIDGEYVFRDKSKVKKVGKKVTSVIAGTTLFTVPGMVKAMDDIEGVNDVNDTFGNVHNAVLNAVDSGVVLVIIFAGASWMLGNRSRAIEILIGVACGYLIISHAVNLRDFLKSI